MQCGQLVSVSAGQHDHSRDGKTERRVFAVNRCPGGEFHSFREACMAARSIARSNAFPSSGVWASVERMVEVPS